MPNPATASPPTPRRCRRILEAHHLDCQGLSLRQIGREIGRAHSTVHAYLRDFQLHRNHILRTVAADQLADQVYCLTEPQTDPAQHQQTVANTRELRLLLLNLPAVQEHDQAWQTKVDHQADHSDHLDQPGSIESDPDQHSQNREESGPIETDLDKSEHQINEFPVPAREFAVPPPNSPPKRRPKPVGPQFPVSWDNPIGYIMPYNADSPMIRRSSSPQSGGDLEAATPAAPVRLPCDTSTWEKGLLCT